MLLLENQAKKVLSERGISVFSDYAKTDPKDQFSVFKNCGSKSGYNSYVSIAFNRDTSSVFITVRKNRLKDHTDSNSDNCLIQEIDPWFKMLPDKIKSAAEFLTPLPHTREKLVFILENLVQTYREKDCLLLEVDLPGIPEQGEFQIRHCKMDIDGNALFRQKDLKPEFFKDTDLLQSKAGKVGMDFVNLDGNIGCIANGAGMAMATIDSISRHGGRAANFLDVKGDVTPRTLKTALEVVLAGRKLDKLLVNIFGGIVSCDMIAEGLVNAYRSGLLCVPAAVRFHGTGSQKARSRLEEVTADIRLFDELEDAVQWVTAGNGSIR